MSDQLFEEEIETRFDWMNAFARERLGMPERWRWFKAEVKNYKKPSEFISIVGAVCDAKIERGKHKGRDNWKKRDVDTECELAIQIDALEQFKLDWQARTGKCFHCYGTGKEWFGWSKEEGTKFRDCPKCKASGSASK